MTLQNQWEPISYQILNTFNINSNGNGKMGDNPNVVAWIWGPGTGWKGLVHVRVGAETMQKSGAWAAVPSSGEEYYHPEGRNNIGDIILKFLQWDDKP